MSATSTIEWTDASWNVVTGCTKVSPGCDHCYAETFAERWRGVPGHPYEQGFDLRLWPERLDLPKHWRKPRLIFVTSMGDLFHARVPYEFVERVWETMAATPQHTYQILTKRPDRMRRFGVRLAERFGILPNVWLGTSVESQPHIGRLAELVLTPAAIRFVSAEPLLGPLDLRRVPFTGGEPYLLDLLEWRYRPANLPDSYGTNMSFGLAGLQRIDWLIVGGESGHGARPCAIDWLRDLRDQCKAGGVACFVKQLGSVLARGLGSTGKGGNPDHWPTDLRVREMPGRTQRQESA